MRLAPIRNTELRRTPLHASTYRVGTAHVSLQWARDHFGAPTDHGDGDKVTAEWHFNTPRGVAILRDYWWNGSEILSIASCGPGAARWLAAYLRTHGVRAYCGMPERFA